MRRTPLLPDGRPRLYSRYFAGASRLRQMGGAYAAFRGVGRPIFHATTVRGGGHGSTTSTSSIAPRDGKPIERVLPLGPDASGLSRRDIQHA